MQAVVVHKPGGPEVLRLEELEIPDPHLGWVLVRVRAFVLNRSELITRAGGSGDAVRFPRVLGIECVGEVVDAPGSDLQPGQRILAAMGGMGRGYDGGYEQYALLPTSQVIPVDTRLDWLQLGAIPESFGTAWGTLEELSLREGQSLLVQGGSSSVGMAAITIAKDRGLTVLATTRQESKRAALQAAGARSRDRGRRRRRASRARAPARRRARTVRAGRTGGAGAGAARPGAGGTRLHHRLPGG
jgi:NADPH2:quinone reductase